MVDSQLTPVFAGLLETATVGLIALDQSGHIVFWNHWMVTHSGIEAEQLGDKTLISVFPEIAGTRLEKAVNDALSNGNAALLTFKINKNLFPLLTYGSSRRPMKQHVMIQPASNTHGGCYIQIMDVTADAEREQLLKEQGQKIQRVNTRLNSLMNSTSVGICSVQIDGQIEDGNSKLLELFSLASSEDLNGRYFQTLFEDLDGETIQWQQVLDDVDAEIAEGKRPTLQWMVKQQSGRYSFPVEVELSRMEDANRIVYVAVVRDISERWQIEKMKREFVSTVSHELRTPLTSISAALGLLTSKFANDIPEKALKLLEIAHNNSGRLIRLVNDILDVEKIEAGRMDFSIQPMSLADTLSDTVEATRSFAVKYDVSIAFDPPAFDTTVLADSDRITQVATNLISNACKFSPSGGEVRIRIVKPDNDRIRVEVDDQGPGIKPSFRDQIFGRFAQQDSTDTREKGGTGLGLNICKLIVEKHGGDIGFDSVEGQGSTFWFDIPTS